MAMLRCLTGFNPDVGRGKQWRYEFLVVTLVVTSKQQSEHLACTSYYMAICLVIKLYARMALAPTYRECHVQAPLLHPPSNIVGCPILIADCSK